MEKCLWESCQRLFWHQFSTSGQSYVWSSNSETAFQSFKVESTSTLTFANFYFGKITHKQFVFLRMFFSVTVHGHWALSTGNWGLGTGNLSARNQNKQSRAEQSPHHVANLPSPHTTMIRWFIPCQVDDQLIHVFNDSAHAKHNNDHPVVITKPRIRFFRLFQEKFNFWPQAVVTRAKASDRNSAWREITLVPWQ